MSDGGVCIGSRVSCAYGDMYNPSHEIEKYGMKRNMRRRRRLKIKVVLSVGPKIRRVLRYGGSTNNFKVNTLNYMGGGPPIPTLILSQDDYVLPNGMVTSNIITVPPTKFVSG